VWVIPGAELVVVHRADTDHDRTVESTDQWRLVESILAARQTEPAPDADLGPLQPAPLSSQLPPVAIPQYRALPASVMTDYLGDYKLAAGATRLGQYRVTEGGAVRVFLFDEKPNMHLPGLSDVQMFPIDRDTFTTRVAPGMRIIFGRNAEDDITTLTVTLDDHTIRASKVAVR
jgi:hypothetical protein